MNTSNFPHVDARYRTESIARYAGNPFIEALPALPSDVSLMKALMHLPPFSPEERSLPASERIQRLDTLQSIVVALPRLVRLARAVLKMMHTGYAPRKPFSTEDNKTLQALYDLQQTGSFASTPQSGLAAQHSMALIGAAGCGKSFGLRQVARLFPPVIFHREIGKWQLPCLFVEMSYDGESVHTLASHIFAEMDRLLPDAGYTDLYMNRRGLNAEQRLAKALSLAHEHAVGIIFVDESQNQKSIGNAPSRRERTGASSSNPKSETPLAKLMVTASNTSHVPLLFAGTLEMQNIGGARFSRARRMAGRGSAVWVPLERSFDLNKPDEYEQLLIVLWRYLYIRIPVALTPAWADLFFSLTQGIPDIMVKLFESAQVAAIANRSETLSPELVANVFKREFVPAAFGITALRDKDRVLLEAVTDLYQADRVEEVRKSQVEFPAPRPVIIKGKERVVRKIDESVAVPARPAKRSRPSPEPISVSIEVAADADLRATLLGVAGAPAIRVSDLNTSSPAQT